MDYFLQLVLNGLFVGAFYALVALGYTMVYGIIKLLNFAHGDIYMVGGFVVTDRMLAMFKKKPRK